MSCVAPSRETNVTKRFREKCLDETCRAATDDHETLQQSRRVFTARVKTMIWRHVFHIKKRGGHGASQRPTQ
jgi:hypothetical protein